MKIRQKDKVVIIAGKDKGKTGVVKKVLIDLNKIVVEGVHIVKKHVKPGVVSKEGGIIPMEKPIDASNALVFCEKCKKGVKVSFKVVDDKKLRVCKKCGNLL